MICGNRHRLKRPDLGESLNFSGSGEPAQNAFSA
jgi:hypothetical protein